MTVWSTLHLERSLQRVSLSRVRKVMYSRMRGKERKEKEEEEEED